MKRVIVTGATGFVGANLARRLVRDGHEVHLLVRHGYTRWRLEGCRQAPRLHETGLDDPAALARVVSAIRPDWIFHLAAYGAYSWQTDARQMAQTNLIGTMNLLEACLGSGFEAFVNTGSSSEYGLKGHAATETEALDPNSHYAVTKASATMYCRYTARNRGVHLPTLRLYSVYGPYEEPARLVPALLLRGLRGGLPPLVDPEVARDYVYVEDAVDAYLLAATAAGQEPGAVYNVGTGVQTSLRQMVDLARGLLGIHAEPRWGTMPNRHWDTSVWVADSRKIRESLGWRPERSLEEGLSRTVDWFRDHPLLADYYYRCLDDPEGVAKGGGRR